MALLVLAPPSGFAAAAENSASEGEAVPTGWDSSKSWEDGSDTGISLQPASVDGISSISDETIRGVGLTSYQAERAAGVTFRDFNGDAVDDAGFMSMLKESGVNYILLKVAVDPNDTAGNTYGGGVPSVENAVLTAQAAKSAGLKVNVQLLYSDFYTSADVQKAPKGWPSDQASRLAKVSTYTKDVLSRFSKADALPDTVTIGSGIKNGFIDTWANYNFAAGDDPKGWERICELISSAVKVVRRDAPDSAVAVGFAEPTVADATTWADMLEYYDVDYDVLGVSVYPLSTSFDALASVRSFITTEYGKRFAVLDAQYPFTSNDSDGTANAPNGWDIENSKVGEATPQGQATYVRKLFKAVVSKDSSDGSGVFYGDATWIAVHPGTNNADKNKDAANTYGTGWASKWASSYVDGVGDYWGASTSDDKALFDDLGKPLKSLNVFSDIQKENDDDKDIVPPAEDPWESGGDTGVTAQTASVKPIDTVTQDTIRGVDISSWQALSDVGVTVRDFDGTKKSLYELLAANGINYVRLRLFVNPYDAEGNSFGGGNDDLENVKKMAVDATKAGLRVNIDLHYNDFYASSWRTPAAWKGFDDEQMGKKVHGYTADVVKTLTSAGVDLGMVQIGNESNSGLLDRTVDWSSDKGWDRYVALLQQASSAVRENAPGAKVAVHMMYTDSGTVDKICGYFKKYGLDYDVFGMTYYAFWSAGSDGTKESDGMAALEKAERVATVKYGKEFAVMEFSQPFTTSDADGYSNNLSGGSEYKSDYPLSVQGQADVIHDVFETVTTADGGSDLGLGAFYWEPAWLPVKPGTNHWLVNRLYANDHGTGWASSYCIANDPTNTSEYNYWGASGWDNQALFDDRGYPLQSLKAFKQIVSGAALKGIFVDASTVKTVYGIGEHLYTDGLIVNGDYGDGDLRPLPLSELDFSGFDSSKKGTCTVTVRYRTSASTFTTSFEVEIVDPSEVTALTVVSRPNTVGYPLGSKLDLTGLRVEATYADGSKRGISVEDLKVSGFDSSRPGKQTITISYEGSSATFQVDVWEGVKNGWVEENGERRWYDWGVMAKSKEFLDPATGAWHWAEADGAIAVDKDVYVPSNGGKWVHYDADGMMVHGEYHDRRGWYYFDPATGAMAHGVRFIPTTNGSGKWVYYDIVTGIMAHGERYLSYDRDHTGWYYFDTVTGEMAHGDVWLSKAGKWVRYDAVTGQMVKGLQRFDGSWYYFDPVTGAMAHGRTWVPAWRSWHEFDRYTGRG